MRSINRCLRLAAFAAVYMAVFASVVIAEVHVKGHYRKDGTYVRPHYRSDPDGNFQNNWSTVGNINPHTLEPGTKRNPPPGYGGGGGSTGRTLYAADGSSYTPTEEPEKPKKTRAEVLAERAAKKQREEQARQNVSERLRARGIEMDWRSHTRTELNDTAFRLGMSDELEEEGIEVDWKNMGSADVNELKNRVQLSKKLTKHNVELAWQDYSAEELHDIHCRIQLAEYLQNVHPSRQKVDWRKYSRDRLSKMTAAPYSGR